MWDAAVEIGDLGAISGPLDIRRLRELTPRRAIIAEPTSLDVVVAHQGVVRWKCATHGRAAHTSRPDEGVNAIYAMSRVVQAVEQHHREVLSSRDPHPLCGTPATSVSTIRGGTGTNTVPAETVIDIDRRLAPGEAPESAYRELVRIIEHSVQDTGAEVTNESPWLQSQGLSDQLNGSLAEQVVRAVESQGSASQIVGAPYGTNAAAYAQVGIPTVVFGPGSIEQAHTKDEWIDTAELSRAVEVLYQLGAGRS